MKRIALKLALVYCFSFASSVWHFVRTGFSHDNNNFVTLLQSQQQQQEQLQQRQGSLLRNVVPAATATRNLSTTTTTTTTQQDTSTNATTAAADMNAHLSSASANKNDKDDTDNKSEAAEEKKSHLISKKNLRPIILSTTTTKRSYDSSSSSLTSSRSSAESDARNITADMQRKQQQEEEAATTVTVIDHSNNTGDDRCTPLPGDKLRRLELLHIPKTGGTALEVIASLQGNIAWGACHWMNWTICPPQRRPQPKTQQTVPRWHMPLQYLETRKFNPYKDADLFAVVRDPFSRLVSQWNYMKVAKRGYKRNNWKHMNKFLIKMLTRVKNATAGSPDYFLEAGHFIPQYDYIHPSTTGTGHSYTTNAPPPIITFIHQENMAEEFDCLKRRYHLDHLSLTERHNARKGGLTVKHLQKKTKQLIEEIYHKDFEVFGYSKRTLTGKTPLAKTS